MQMQTESSDKQQIKPRNREASFGELYRAGVQKEELMKKFLLNEKEYNKIIVCLKELGTV